MQKKETIEALVPYCDVCGCRCWGHTTLVRRNGDHFHVCHNYNDKENATCEEILRKRLNESEVER